MRKFIVAILAAFTSISCAHAADLNGYKDQPAVNQQSWSGFSVSVAGGATFLDNTLFAGDVDSGLGFSTSGFTGLVRAQYLIGNRFLVGPYVDASYTTSSSPLLDAQYGYGAGLKAEYTDGAGGIYGAVGWHRSHLSMNGYDLSKDVDALRLGGGLEYRVAKHLVLFTEGDFDLNNDVGIAGYHIESVAFTGLAGIRIPVGN